MKKTVAILLIALLCAVFLLDGMVRGNPWMRQAYAAQSESQPMDEVSVQSSLPVQVETEPQDEREVSPEVPLPAQADMPSTTQPLTETEVPSKTEAPTQTGPSSETPTPAETGAPSRTEVPLETEVPSQAETTNEVEAPSETEIPIETEAPTEAEAPLETEAGDVQLEDYSVPIAAPGETLTLAIPIRYSQGDLALQSNAGAQGGILAYDAGRAQGEYDQAIGEALAEVSLSFAESQAADFPLSRQVLSLAPVIVSDGLNVGYGVFKDVQVLETATPGDHPIQLQLMWREQTGERHSRIVRGVVSVAQPAGYVTLGTYETPSAQAGDSVSLVFPIRYTEEGAVYASNAGADGGIVPYGSEAAIDQSIASMLKSADVTIAAEQEEDFPLAGEILSQSQTVLSDGENAGYAAFEQVPVREDARPGIYPINLVVSWQDTDGTMQTTMETASIEVSARSIVHDDGIIVFTFAELKNAMTGAVNGVTYNTIYLGYCDSAAPAAGETKNDGSIQFTASGGIPVTRNVTIIGTDPRNGHRVRLTDRVSSIATDTIYANANNLTITLKHMDVTGYNFYGIIHSVGRATAINFVDVTYQGRQMTCNYGSNTLVSFTDCHVTLQGMSTGEAQEVAEVAEVRFYGKNTFTKTASLDTSMFWLNESPRKMTVAAGADVSVNTVKYFVYNDGTANTTMDIAGSLEVTTSGTIGCMTYDVQGFSAVTVDSSGSLKITQNANTLYASLRVANLTVAGVLDIQRTASTQPCISLTSAAGGATFNNPKRVSLRNSSGKLVASASTTPKLNISTQAINIWPSGGTNKYIWNNNDFSPFSVVCTLTGSSTNTVGVTGLSNGDKGVSLVPHSIALSKGTFDLTGASRLELGRYVLTIDPNTVYLGSHAVTGTTMSGSTQTVEEYKKNGTVLQPSAIQSVPAITAGGSYEAALLNSITSNDTSRIYVKSLQYDLEVHVYQDPIVFFELYAVPDNVDFGTIGISGSSRLMPRQSPQAMEVKVRDTRGHGGWRLKAQATAPLTQESGVNPDVLGDALVFVSGGVEQSLLSQVTFKEQPAPAMPGVTTLSWGNTEGLMLRLRPYVGKPGATYRATILWTLEQSP